MDKLDLVQFLMFGGCFDNMDYEKPPDYMDITFDEALAEYNRLLGSRVKRYTEMYYTLSGGYDSSLIYTFLQMRHRTICFKVNGNSDYDYACRLDPFVIIDNTFNDIDVEKKLIEMNNQMDKPHCFRSDLYDYHMYTSSTKCIFGDDPIHLNLSDCIVKSVININTFLNSILIFKPHEIKEFGYEPIEYDIKGRFEELIYFVYDWYTKLSRKLFFDYGMKSPYFDDEVISFYKNIPIEYQLDKKLIKQLVKMKLPDFIYNRKKGIPPIGKTQWYEEHQLEIDKIEDKYLKSPDMKIYNWLDYDLVMKHKEDYHKKWMLINLSIWLEYSEQNIK